MGVGIVASFPEAYDTQNVTQWTLFSRVLPIVGWISTGVFEARCACQKAYSFLTVLEALGLGSVCNNRVLNHISKVCY